MSHRARARRSPACRTDAEVFVAGARFDEALEPFAVRAAEIDMVQYGSDDTKTHRKIKHILGAKLPWPRRPPAGVRTLHRGRGRLVRLSQPQARHRPPAADETRHDETYNFRFQPAHGSGLQMLQREDDEAGRCLSHRGRLHRAASTRAITPAACCRATRCITSPSSAASASAAWCSISSPPTPIRSQTIPGIMDMVAKFK